MAKALDADVWMFVIMKRNLAYYYYYCLLFVLRFSYLPLTQFVEVSLGAVLLQDRTHHPGLEEGGPLVHQAALPSDVILQPAVEKKEIKIKTIATTVKKTQKQLKNQFSLLAYRTHPGHHGVDVLCVPAVVHQPLAEEEVELGVVGVRAVRDQVGVDEDRL